MTGARPEEQPAEDLESTAELLSRVRAGDSKAREQLFRRLLPLVRQFARRRIPSRIRDLTDSDDLVQETLLRTFRKIGDIEPRGGGALFAYVRRILLNLIADELRRVRRHPGGEPVSDDIADAGHTPLELAIGQDTLQAYEAALEQLPEDQRHAVILRVDFGCTHDEVAEVLRRPSANAARMLVARGLVSLAEHMGRRS